MSGLNPDYWDDDAVADMLAEREDARLREQYEDHAHTWPYVEIVP